MKKEIVIIPHGNQIKAIRELQSKLCFEHKVVPVFPLFVRFSEKIQKAEEFKSCRIEKILFSNEEISLSVNLTSASSIHNGKIKIGKFSENCDKINEVIFELNLPVFRVCEAEFLEDDESVEWKILSEKWKKMK